jgi:hypothetical protein
VGALKLAGPATLDAPNPSLVRRSSGTEESLMAGRHRLKGRRQKIPQHGVPHRAIEVVDARTLTAHFLTADAMAAGRLPEGRYTALCGEDVLPACLVEPGAGRCSLCVVIPRQRTEQQLTGPDDIAVYAKAFEPPHVAALAGQDAAALIQRVAAELRA